MQISADITESSKTVERELTFTLNVLPEFIDLFCLFSNSFCQKNVTSFIYSGFVENYAETCKCIFSYNLV